MVVFILKSSDHFGIPDTKMIRTTKTKFKSTTELWLSERSNSQISQKILFVSCLSKDRNCFASKTNRTSSCRHNCQLYQSLSIYSFFFQMKSDAQKIMKDVFQTFFKVIIFKTPSLIASSSEIIRSPLLRKQILLFIIILSQWHLQLSLEIIVKTCATIITRI